MTQNDALAGTLNRIAGRRDPVARAAWFVNTALLNMTGRLGNVAGSDRRTGGSVESPIGKFGSVEPRALWESSAPMGHEPLGSSAPMGHEPLGSSALWATSPWEVRLCGRELCREVLSYGLVRMYRLVRAGVRRIRRRRSRPSPRNPSRPWYGSPRLPTRSRGNSPSDER